VRFSTELRALGFGFCRIRVEGWQDRILAKVIKGTKRKDFGGTPSSQINETLLPRVRGKGGLARLDHGEGKD